jgi:hypothetical protein
LYFKVFEDLSEPTFLNAGSVAIKMTDWRARTGHVVDNEQCRITGFSIIVPGPAAWTRSYSPLFRFEKRSLMSGISVIILATVTGDRTFVTGLEFVRGQISVYFNLMAKSGGSPI